MNNSILIRTEFEEVRKDTQFHSNPYFDQIASDKFVVDCEKVFSKFAIEFVDWLSTLTPSERVSVWSKDGQYKGLFTMDNEQLLEKFLTK
jgi:hypothetical protein